MAADLKPERIETIGSAAGLVWHYLSDNGAVTLSKLARDIDAPRDLVMQGVGWLAREEKIVFEKGPRAKRVKLADHTG